MRPDELEGRLARLDTAEWEPESPPPLDAEAVVARSGRRPAPSWWSGLLRPTVVLRPAVALACAVVLLAGGVLGGVLLSGGEAGRAPGAAPRELASVPLRPLALAPAGAGARAVIVEAGGTRELDLDARGLAPSQPGQFYEVWALRSAERLVSLGTFRVGADGRAHARMAMPVDARAFPVVDISVERADGDPTHSGRSVLRSEA
jgi:anti-sigma-K factor RskA